MALPLPSSLRGCNSPLNRPPLPAPRRSRSSLSAYQRATGESRAYRPAVRAKWMSTRTSSRLEKSAAKAGPPPKEDPASDPTSDAFISQVTGQVAGQLEAAIGKTIELALAAAEQRLAAAVSSPQLQSPPGPAPAPLVQGTSVSTPHTPPPGPPPTGPPPPTPAGTRSSTPLPYAGLYPYFGPLAPCR